MRCVHGRPGFCPHCVRPAEYCGECNPSVTYTANIVNGNGLVENAILAERKRVAGLLTKAIDEGWPRSIYELRDALADGKDGA